MNVTLNASDFLYSTHGGPLPEVSATIRDIGTSEALFFAFVLWWFAVCAHELGHWFYLLTKNKDAVMIVKRYGIGIALQTGTEADYAKLTKEEKITLYLSGIVAGFAPIVVGGLIHPIYFLIIPAYVVGTYRDMELIWQTIKE